MSNFHDVISAGIKRIYEEDLTQQEYNLDFICSNARGMPSGVLKQSGAFFVPNDKYMLEFFGSGVMLPELDCYSGAECIWNNYLVVPVRDVSDTIVGLAGFNPFMYLEAKETQNWSITYYRYTNKSIFHKGRYLFGIPGAFLKAKHDGYCVLLDGFFDTLNSAQNGFNALGVLGSDVTPEIAAQLRFIKKTIVLVDNDEAGLRLFNQLHKYNPKITYCFKQGRVKDADDSFKSDFANEYATQLRDFIENGNPFLTYGHFKEPKKHSSIFINK